MTKLPVFKLILQGLELLKECLAPILAFFLGKKSEQLKDANDEIRELKKSGDISNRILTDSDYRDSVRKRADEWED